jgi:hypothetical protein
MTARQITVSHGFVSYPGNGYQSIQVGAFQRLIRLPFLAVKTH